MSSDAKKLKQSKPDLKARKGDGMATPKRHAKWTEFVEKVRKELAWSLDRMCELTRLEMDWVKKARRGGEISGEFREKFQNAINECWKEKFPNKPQLRWPDWVDDAPWSEAGTAVLPAAHTHPTPVQQIEAKPKSSPLVFVDWVLSDWPQLYCKELKSCATYSHKGRRHQLPQVLILDNTEQKQPLRKFSIRLHEPRFVLPPDVCAMTEEAFVSLGQTQSQWTNDENLRLHELQGRELIVQRVRYEDYLRTNMVLDFKSRKGRVSLREKVHGSHKLEPLWDSSFANHLGVNILLFTADGSLVLQKRSKKVSIRQGELCSAASGALSKCDVSVPVTLDHVHLFREGYEELGVFTEDGVTEHLELLGITRELIRGGKPELFLSADSRLLRSQVLTRWERAHDNFEADELIFYPFDSDVVFTSLDKREKRNRFTHQFDGLIDECGDRASIPLLTNLALWQHWKLIGG